MLQDSLGRVMGTLRLSVTDRCDMRCTYCMPAGGLDWLPRQDLLSFEELSRLARVFAGLGLKRIRITGGEPLLRQGLPELVRQISQIPGIEDLSLTSNGSRLAELARPLKEAGLKRVTLSLDSLDAERFRQITRGGDLARVLVGLRVAAAVGLKPLKVNCVVLEANQEDLLPLAAFTLENDIEVRFIEPMPISAGLSAPAAGPTPKRLRQMIEERWGSLQGEAVSPSAPARSYRLRGAMGKIGFISSVSESFCSTCDRLRLSPSGRLQLCLAQRDGIDLRAPLRAGSSDAVLARLITEAVWRKPAGHAFNSAPAEEGQAMSRIGG